jgi:hypothetical protein
MTKRKSKAPAKTSKTKAKSKTTTRASTAKTSVAKRSAAPADNGAGRLIVLGYDDQQKPRGARFDHDKPNLVTKAAEAMGLKVYKASSSEVAAVAQKLPAGRLYANGRGFVPNIRQTLYSDLIAALARKPETLLGGASNGDVLPPARGLPLAWDEIAPGHLVIAQESLDHGWWEAIVLATKNGSFRLQFRDFPNLPKFVRDRSGIALMYPQPADASSLARAWDEIKPGDLVIAQESPHDGWWEAIVVERKDDAFTCRFRDYTDLPTFVRHKSGIALMASPTKVTQPATLPQQA